MARTGLRSLLLLVLLALATALWGKKSEEPAKKVASDVTKLQIGVKRKVADCARRAADGDRVYVHYRGTLTDGEQFDASCAHARSQARSRNARAAHRPRCRAAAVPYRTARGAAHGCNRDASGAGLMRGRAIVHSLRAQTTATNRSISCSARGA